MKKLPPIEKVYEAWSAIADGRVRFENKSEDGSFVAIVGSSDATKSYTVSFDSETDTYSSDDNATFWQGYAGYPVIAVMMLTGVLPFNEAEAEKWKGVNWNSLNQSFKRNYAEAVNHVERERGIDVSQASRLAELTMEKLSESPVKVKRLVKK